MSLLAMFVPIAVWSPGSLSGGLQWTVIAAALLSQVLVFAIIAWVMSTRSIAKSMIAAIVAMMAAAVLMDITVSSRSLIPAAVAANLGVVIAYNAYHRCLKADML